MTITLEPISSSHESAASASAPLMPGADGAVHPLDAALARWMAEREPEHARALGAAVLLLSMALREGHTALSLADLDGTRAAELDAADLGEVRPSIPSADSIRDALKKSRLVGAPGERTPLVLDEDLLFFRRFHDGECRILEAVCSRLENARPPREVEHLKALLQQLFESENDGEIDWQPIAAAAALRSRFLCVAGGPGTGKTTTVTRLMVLLLEDDPTLRIALAAPTGKAANRMAESIGNELEQLRIAAELKERVPTSAATLHRLLRYRPSEARFTYGADRKLEADVVIVDEASMIDHELFTSLLAALEEETRLILLGDPDQLPSVDAGFVFGDLCRSVEGAAKSADFEAFLADLGLGALPQVELPAAGASKAGLSRSQLSRSSPSPIHDAVITLTRGYRFGPDSGIGHLAYALRDGRSDEAVRVLTSGGYGDLRLVPPSEQKGVVRRAVRDLASALIGASSPEDALTHMQRLRVLSPLRIGPRGSEAINEELEGWLLDERLRPWGREYAGKPILINRNDYDVSLFNGDVGVLWKRGERFVGCFPDGDGIREIPLHRLPPYEVAWAMTVHKAQGSEFDQVILVLPDEEDAGHLTRELLYTAVTRARSSVTVIGEADVIAGAATRKEMRVTGLGRLLRALGPQG